MPLDVIGLKRSFPDFSLSLDFNVQAGEILALVGPSGSGKTTALNLIAGLLKPDSGKIIIDGKDVSSLPGWQRSISMVFQDLSLFPHLNVGGNIAYGLVMRKVKRSERERIIAETLAMVRLPGFASRRIQTLSGGERQRVAIARALAYKPKALLLDEPFSSLDLPLRNKMRHEFLEIHSRLEVPCVFVTHDREEAAMLGDRLALMHNGKIIESGTGSEIFLSPKTEFASRFFGMGQVLPCINPEKHSETYIEVTTPLGKMIVPKGSGYKQKLFIPNDAISVTEETDTGFKAYSALLADFFFDGTNFKLELLLPENINFEILMKARNVLPVRNSEIKFWVNQSLVRFVE